MARPFYASLLKVRQAVTWRRIGISYNTAFIRQITSLNNVSALEMVSRI